MKSVFRFKEIIAIIISILSSIILFKERNGSFNLVHPNLALYGALLNIGILVIGIVTFSIFNNDYYLLKRINGDYDDSGLKDLSAISAVLKIPEDGGSKTRYFVERTSAIVGQLVNNFSLFLWPLIIFYSINIVKDKMHFNIQFDDYSYSFLQFVRECGDGTEKFTNDVFWYLTLSALANIFNFISAIGLWVCFSILYQKTLDAENKSTQHLGVYYFLLTFYILSYIVLLGTGIEILTIKQTILTLDLFCAVFNCVAMILFFNRLVQILYFFQSALREKLLDKFYFFIATILFPLYACFQIFFAVFDQILNDSNYYVQVKGTVFFICFLGKLFLMLFLFSFIRLKWLHAAILTLVAYEGVPSALAKKVKAISNSINFVNEDVKSWNE